MSWIVQSQTLTVLAFGFLIFLAVYFSSDKLIKFFHNKFLFTYEEVVKIMDNMLIEVDSRKIMILLSLLSYGLGLIALLFTLPNITLGLLLGIPLVLAGLVIPRNFMRSLWLKRSKKAVAQMIDCLITISNGIKSGMSIVQSIERVVEKNKGPLPQELQLVLNKFRLGMPLEEALEEMAARLDQPDMYMFVSSVNILKETGGNMAQTFDVISETLRERQRVEKKIEAMMAQSRNQGRFLSVVPLIVLGLLLVTNPSYVKPLFETTLGWIILSVMFTFQIVGAIMMKKIAIIKV